jgi:hypothetical protein
LEYSETDRNRLLDESNVKDLFKENEEMTRSTARWTIAFAATALLAVPAAGLAQGVDQPPSQPPTATGASDPAAQPPAPAPPNQQAAKQHLTEARNALSEMTQLPAASQLTGEARTQVSELITNFNELITTPTAWKTSYAKVQANLNALIGSATTDESAARTTGTEGAVGTSGTVAVDPAIKAKLIEFRAHLDKFEQAAGGATPSSDAAAAMATPPASGTPPPAGATTPPATAGTPPPSTPPAAAAPPPPATPEQQAAAQAPAMDQHELARHVMAIEAILNAQGAASGTTGTEPSAAQMPLTLSPEQLAQLRMHLGELKRLLNQR